MENVFFNRLGHNRTLGGISSHRSICVGSGEAIEKSDIAFSGTERRRSPENLRLVEIVRIQRLERNRKKVEGEGQ